MRRRASVLALALVSSSGCAVEARLAVADGGSTVDVLVDAGSIDAPAVDAPVIDVPAVDVPVVDVPVVDAVTRRFVTAIAPGSCALLDDGTVWCWGANSYGQIGDGTITPSPLPAMNPYLTGIAAIAMSATHACAVNAAGDLSCWGQNEAGESGPSMSARVYAPRPVAGLSNVVQVSLGQYVTCAVERDGSVWCWGDNSSGQGGRGMVFDHSGTPQRVPGVAGAVQVAAGGATVCARLGDGALMCWGNNEYGSVGDGSTSQSSTPVRVAGIDDAIDVDTGGRHACAVRRDHTVWCWGTDAFDSFPIGNFHTTPQRIAGVTDAEQLALGIAHACVRLTDGTVECWGTDFINNAADGWNGSYGTDPVAIGGTRGSVDVRSGDGTVCVRFADGRAACWGGAPIELGDGTTSPRMNAGPVVFP